MFKEFQSSTSLLQYLMQRPDWGTVLLRKQISSESLAASKLFDLWQKSGTTNGYLSRPPEFPKSNIDMMRECGLIREIGDRIEVTKKGSEAIRSLILGDDRSI